MMYVALLILYGYAVSQTIVPVLGQQNINSDVEYLYSPSVQQLIEQPVVAK